MSDVINLDGGEVMDVSAYPLPEGIADDTLNMNLIAKAMGVSTVTITRWMDDGMPISQRGGNGQNYEFQLSHVWAWRMWRQDTDQAERRRKDDLATQVAMHFLGNDYDGPMDGGRLSAKEIAEFSEAEYKRNRVAEQRGDLVRRGQVERVMEDVLVSFRRAVMNLPDWLEQEFSLTAHQVEKAQTYCDNVLSEARRLISETSEIDAEVVEFEKINRPA